VPFDFPLGLARSLRRLNIKLKVAKERIFPERTLKSREEVKKISATLMMAEVGLAEGIQALKHSRISRDRKLIYRNLSLTSERLRSIIDTAVLQAGGMACQTIVAGGLNGCDPHEIGHGPLKANEPIILDVFPRSSKTGYCGDITRTVVRGRASEEIRKLYDTVKSAQDLAVRNLTAGSACRDVHDSVLKYFVGKGYKTGRSRNDFHGFYHGTGHGVGLEVHESPNITSNSDAVLASRMVVAVEPGLYYAELNGGVRLEDVVLVNNGKPRKLSKFEKVLEI
jgi:Xaa-Pro aminopeptidase